MFSISFQLKAKVHKAKATDSCGQAKDFSTHPDLGDDLTEDIDFPIEDAVEVMSHDTQADLPTIQGPKRRDGAPKTNAKSGMSTPSSEPTVNQNLMKVLAARAVDSQQWKDKFDTVLAAEKPNPEKGEKSIWGEWLASCAGKVPDARWAQFLKITFGVMNDFVPRNAGITHQTPTPTPQSVSQPTVSQATVSHSPNVQMMPPQTPPTFPPLYGQSYGQQSGQFQSSGAYSGFGQSYSQPGSAFASGSTPGASFSGYGEADVMTTATTSTQGQVTPQYSTNALNISTPQVSANSSSGMLGVLSPSTLISASMNIVNTEDASLL